MHLKLLTEAVEFSIVPLTVGQNLYSSECYCLLCSYSTPDAALLVRNLESLRHSTFLSLVNKMKISIVLKIPKFPCLSLHIQEVSPLHLCSHQQCFDCSLIQRICSVKSLHFRCCRLMIQSQRRQKVLFRNLCFHPTH